MIKIKNRNCKNDLFLQSDLLAFGDQIKFTQPDKNY